MCSSLAPHLDIWIGNMDSHCSLVPSCSPLAPAIQNGVLLTSRRQCTCIHLLVDQVIPGIIWDPSWENGWENPWASMIWGSPGHPMKMETLSWCPGLTFWGHPEKIVWWSWALTRAEEKYCCYRNPNKVANGQTKGGHFSLLYVYNHSQNGGESLLSYPYAIRQTKMGYKTQKHGDNNNSEWIY